MQPEPDGSNPPVVDLPEARGFVGHLSYVWQYFRLSRSLRQAVEGHDVSLRRAVAARDEALSALGVAVNELEGLPPRLHAFKSTLVELETDRAEREREKDDLAIDQAAAEAAKRTTLADFDVQVDAVKAKLDPATRTYDRLHGELLELERIEESQSGQRRNLEARLERIDKTQPVDEAARDRLQEERHGIHARLEALLAEMPPRAAAIAALRQPLKDAAAARDEHAEALSAVREARRAARLAADAEIERLQDLVKAATQKVATAVARRGATQIDLGREALADPDFEGAMPQQTAARETLAAIKTLRSDRSALQARREQLDAGPVKRVGLITGAALLLLIVLIWIF